MEKRVFGYCVMIWAFGNVRYTVDGGCHAAGGCTHGLYLPRRPTRNESEEWKGPEEV